MQHKGPRQSWVFKKNGKIHLVWWTVAQSPCRKNTSLALSIGSSARRMCPQRERERAEAFLFTVNGNGSNRGRKWRKGGRGTEDEEFSSFWSAASEDFTVQLLSVSLPASQYSQKAPPFYSEGPLDLRRICPSRLKKWTFFLAERQII